MTIMDFGQHHCVNLSEFKNVTVASEESLGGKLFDGRSAAFPIVKQFL